MLVWDPFVRVFHWLLVAGFAANYFELVREGKLAHQVIGYVVLGLVAARILWGFVGPRHAQFSSFIARPSEVLQYIGDMLAHRSRRHVGHNPAGAAMVLALLAAAILVGLTGWLSTTDWFFGSDFMEEAHEILANLMLALAGLHILGVIHASWRHRENLVKSMVTGRKRGG
jgi:cytochrome b